MVSGLTIANRVHDLAPVRASGVTKADLVVEQPRVHAV